MRVEYHPAVERELREIIHYYNGCSAGLGNEFLNEFERQVLSIASNPSQWVEIEEGVRQIRAQEEIMMSKLTQKNQATIPEPVRKYLSLQAGDSVRFEVEDGRIYLNKAPAVDYAFTMALEGTLDEWSSAADDEAYGGLCIGNDYQCEKFTVAAGCQNS